MLGDHRTETTGKMVQSFARAAGRTWKLKLKREKVSKHHCQTPLLLIRSGYIPLSGSQKELKTKSPQEPSHITSELFLCTQTETGSQCELIKIKKLKCSVLSTRGRHFTKCLLTEKTGLSVLSIIQKAPVEPLRLKRSIKTLSSDDHSQTVSWRDQEDKLSWAQYRSSDLRRSIVCRRPVQSEDWNLKWITRTANESPGFWAMQITEHGHQIY